MRITASLRAYVEDGAGGHILQHGGEERERGAVRVLDAGARRTRARRGRWSRSRPRAEGDHHLDEEIVASPWSDTQRLADESLTELAVEDGLPPGFTTADLAVVSFDGTAREQALDLSLADARFAPDVLEAAARRAVAAWAEAVDGDDAALWRRWRRPRRCRSCSTGRRVAQDPRRRARPARARDQDLAVDVSREPGDDERSRWSWVGGGTSRTGTRRRWWRDRESAGKFSERWVLGRSPARESLAARCIPVISTNFIDNTLRIRPMRSVDVHQHLWPEAVLRVLERRGAPPKATWRGDRWRVELPASPASTSIRSDHDPDDAGERG